MKKLSHAGPFTEEVVIGERERNRQTEKVISMKWDSRNGKYSKVQYYSVLNFLKQ